MKHWCEYTLKGCRCEGGVQEPDCDEVLCDEPASIKIHQQWYCEKHGDRVQAILDRHEKGTPLPPDFFERQCATLSESDTHHLTEITDASGDLALTSSNQSANAPAWGLAN